jgi:glycosyltransferase involved in cell wall biosynthesis
MNLASAGPLVTVIVPVFNGARYLRESLDSILAQTYPRIEVLVMDDASTDATAEIIASFGGAVRMVRQPQTLGIYANANVGIEMARGEFVAIYHADDIYLPTIVEREVEFLLKYPQAGAVFASDIFVDAEGREYGRLTIPPEVRGDRLLDGAAVVDCLLTYMNTFLRCPGTMVRADVYRSVGSYRQDRYRNTSDLDMWLRIARHCPIGILEEHLFRYRHFHGSSGERYHHLRTSPGRTFTILDDHLAEWAGQFAGPLALRAYEAHRAEDALMRAVSLYILGRFPEARRVLTELKLERLLGSSQVQRVRLLALWVMLHCLLRLPRSGAIAEMFLHRWHTRGAGA